MQKVFRKLSYLVAAICVSIIFSYNFYAHAASASVSVSAVGGNVVDNYINSTNTGFIISAELDEAYQKAEIYINDSKFSEIYNIEGRFRFESGDLDTASIHKWFNKELSSVEIKLYQEDPSPQQVLSANITADFDAPSGEFSAKRDQLVETKSVLGVGDRVILTFTPDKGVNDVKSVSAKIYDRALTWQPVPQKDGSIVYQAVYVIQEGDRDQSASLPLTEVAVQDNAGNLNSYGNIQVSIDFRIDANSPQLTIASPLEDKVYNSKDVPLDFSATGYDTLKIFLDGNLTSLTAGQNLEDLSDGVHTIKIEAADSAKNTIVKEVSFSVDTVAPPITPITSPDGGKIEQGSTIVFEGVSEAGAQITLEIFSEPQVLQTVADAAGKWRFEFDSNKLSLGTHDAYVTVADQAGNSFKLKIATFEVEKPESPKLALNEQPRQETPLISQDVTPKVISRPQTQTQAQVQPEPQEVAKEGKISSAETARVPTTNWGAWILLLAIVALASALAAAGYYGYEWAIANSSVVKKGQEVEIIEKIEKEVGKRETIVSPKKSENLSKKDINQDTPRRQARW